MTVVCEGCGGYGGGEDYWEIRHWNGNGEVVDKAHHFCGSSCLLEWAAVFCRDKDEQKELLEQLKQAFAEE